MSFRFRRLIGVVLGLAVVVPLAACTAASGASTPDMSDFAGVAEYYKQKGFHTEVEGASFGEVLVELGCADDDLGGVRSYKIEGEVGGPLVAEVTFNGPGPDTYTTKSYRFTTQPTKDEVARDNLCGGEQPGPPTPTIMSAPALPSGASTFSAIEQPYVARGFNVVGLGYADYLGVWLDLKCEDHKPRWFQLAFQPGDALMAVRTSHPDPNTLVTKQYMFDQPPSAAEIRDDKLCADGPAPARVWNVPEIEKALRAAHFDIVPGSAQRYSNNISFEVDLGCPNGVTPAMFVVAPYTGDDSMPPEFDPSHPHLKNLPASQGGEEGDFAKPPTAKDIDEFALCSS